MDDWFDKITGMKRRIFKIALPSLVQSAWHRKPDSMESQFTHVLCATAINIQQTRRIVRQRYNSNHVPEVGSFELVVWNLVWERTYGNRGLRNTQTAEKKNKGNNLLNRQDNHVIERPIVNRLKYTDWQEDGDKVKSSTIKWFINKRTRQGCTIWIEQ